MELSSEKLLPQGLIRFLSMVIAGKEDVVISDWCSLFDKFYAMQYQRENGRYLSMCFSV